MDIQVNGFPVTCLFDSGSTESFVHPDTVRHCSLKVYPRSQRISMASSSHSAEVCGYCVATLTVSGTVYQDLKLMVLPQLCAAVILGLDFQCHLSSLTLQFRGPLPPSPSLIP